MSTGQARAVMGGDLQIVPVNDKPTSTAMTSALPPKPPGGGGASSNALVEYTRPVFREEEEDLEVKLRRILDNVPVRVSNTSGSSAGSGSGDFHQYRQMRRKEQDRLSRMEADYQRRKEVAEFEIRREYRLKATEERTAKKRAKRQKKKQRKKEKLSNVTADGEMPQNESSSDDDVETDKEQPGDA
ncbi:hypothetical protein KSS87_021468 [Heliosperma pusillum]|nr:hypothetical protein KSS87_020016 [Heliosperma pusillum]KAH9622112.1 hypothetical protein KSS87_021468 [Heliosperma pusillum]